MTDELKNQNGAPLPFSLATFINKWRVCIWFPGTLKFLSDVESDILILEVAPNNFVNPKPSPLTPGDAFSFSSFFSKKERSLCANLRGWNFSRWVSTTSRYFFIGLPILVMQTLLSQKSVRDP